LHGDHNRGDVIGSYESDLILNRTRTRTRTGDRTLQR